ncbi:ATP-binding protein [Sorangium sp. So ce429]
MASHIPSAAPEPTRLGSHTLASLCNELLAGRPVLFGAQDELFQLAAIESRSVLAWYVENTTRWAGNVLRDDIERIVDRLGTVPPAPPPTAIAGPDQTRVIHVTRMKAHRFAGLHHYGAPSAPPDVFEFDFMNEVTIFEGRNGAGKTSLLSAICWCLTGEAYRTQQPPTEIHSPISVFTEQSSDAQNGVPNRVEYTTVAAAPVPSADALASLNGKPLKVDTWVELTLSDDAGNEVAIIRREIVAAGTQRFKTRFTGHERLALDPIAFQLGTTFPGVIHHIKLGESSSIGEAVSNLTGIRPLQDLAKHARRVRDKLAGELTKERREQITRSRKQYEKLSDDLVQKFSAYPELTPSIPIAQPDDIAVATRTAEQHVHHFGQLETAWLADASVLLGGDFNPRDAAARRQLSQTIGPALGALQSHADLPSIVRLHKLSLSEESVEAARTLLSDIVAHSMILEEAAKQPLINARRQLYARVAQWHAEHQGLTTDISSCPVCLRTLEGIVDPHTGTGVSAEIRRVQEAHEAAVTTVSEWIKGATFRLRTELPESLREELDRDLPGSPLELIKAAYCHELFRKPAFSGLLQQLRQVVAERWEFYLSPPKVDAFVEPTPVSLPSMVSKIGADLINRMHRVQRALAFSEWLHKNSARRDAAYDSVIGRELMPTDERNASPASVSGWSLSRRLLALNSIIENTEPLRAALRDVELLREQLQAINEHEKRLSAYARAAEALEPLVRLERLVNEQVNSLVTRLSNQTIQWRDRIYQREIASGPRVVRASVAGADLQVTANVGGTCIHAQHVVNASDLRATLLAFLFALREYVLENRGGLSLLLLDDPQEMFDGWNRRRLADAIVSLGGKYCRSIVTTSDKEFANDMDSFARGTTGAATREVSRWSVHPCSNNRPCVGIVPYVGTIEKKRREFDTNENDHAIAREYVMYLRIWLEGRLFDLLHDAQLPPKPTLSDVLGEIRGRMRDGREPFSLQSFRALCNDAALAQGSQFIKLMNESHHSRGALISYADVKVISGDCDKIRRLVDAAHEDYARYLRRDPPHEQPTLPPMPPAVTLPSIRVPMLYGIAALADSARSSEVADESDVLDSTWFDSKAIYRLRTHNLGFSARHNDLVIVNLKSVQTEDNRVFIACHGEKVYARRVYRDRSQPGLVVLASEAENPLKRVPTRILPASQVRLLKIVGVLFDGTETYDRSSEEAVLEPDALRSLREVACAVRIRHGNELGGSAIPLALPGQTLLVGAELHPADLENHRGGYVVVSTTDGDLFKCVGDSIAGAPHVRMFDSVGGRGQSLLLRTEDVNGSFEKVPLLLRARRVLGVLYPP